MAKPFAASRPRRLRKAALLAATGAAVLGAAPLWAQDAALRGSLGAGDTTVASRPYIPASPGALSELDRTPSIFDPQPDNDDPFAPSAPAPRPARDDDARGTLPAQPQDPAVTAAARVPAAGEDDTTGSIAARSQATIDADAFRAVGQAGSRADAIERRTTTFEEAPFSPVGLRLGSFQAYPSLEQGLTYTNNANNSSEKRSAVLSETTLRLAAVSDWSRHSANFNTFGTFRTSIDGEKLEEVRAGLDAALRLDLAGDYALIGTVAYFVAPESASSPVVIEGTLDQPIRHRFETSLGLEKDLGPLRFATNGRIEREVFGDAELSTGGTLSQAERNSTLAAFTLRTGYAISPALTPFVEGEIGQRFYDEEIDSAGYRRSALRTGLAAGVEFDITEKLQGEISAGWVAENFRDPRLETLSGLDLGADLRWSPMRGTIVALNASTFLEASTTPGDAGSILHSAALSATRDLRANLTGTAALGLGWRDFRAGGRDLIWSTEASLTYWLNRYAGLTGRARYEAVDSTLPGRSTDTASIFMGLRFQR